MLIFAEGDHDSAMIGDGEVYVACQTCHNNELGAVHANQCSTSHPSPYDTLEPWTGRCQQDGCHTTYHDDSRTAHWAVEDDCTQCHNSGPWDVPPSSCANCHAIYNPADTVPPVTTSDAQSSYFDIPANITLTATDNGTYGVKTTYYTFNGGPTQMGTFVYNCAASRHLQLHSPVLVRRLVREPGGTQHHELHGHRWHGNASPGGG